MKGAFSSLQVRGVGAAAAGCAGMRDGTLGTDGVILSCTEPRSALKSSAQEQQRFSRGSAPGRRQMAPLSGRHCSPASDAFLVVQPPSSREAVLLLPRDNQKLFRASFCLRILLYFLIALFLLVSYLLAQWVSSVLASALSVGATGSPPPPHTFASHRAQTGQRHLGNGLF